MNNAPSVAVRVATLQQAAIDHLDKDPSRVILRPLTTEFSAPGWGIEINERVITIEVPTRGQDGAYILVISGSALPLIKMGIDKYASGYQFHRISAPSDEIAFTTEWKGLPPMNDAMNLIGFLGTIQQIGFSTMQWKDVEGK